MSDPKHPRATETEQFCELIGQHLGGWEPTVILDCGAADAKQSEELLDRYRYAVVYAFEGNPNQHGHCIQAAKRCPRITFVPMAVCEHNGFTKFFHIQTNGAAGSVFEPSGIYDPIEKMPSVTLKVPCCRLDSYIIASRAPMFDAMWLDAQGSELAIIRSLGKYLANVRAIWTEFMFVEIYKGQPLLNDLDSFLSGAGFSLVHKHDCAPGYFGEACFLKL